MIDGWGISYEIALIWMPMDFTDDQSTLVQVMAWCRKATSHYLSQCWPRLCHQMTRPQWVNRHSQWCIRIQMVCINLYMPPGNSWERPLVFNSNTWMMYGRTFGRKECRHCCAAMYRKTRSHKKINKNKIGWDALQNWQYCEKEN